MKRITVSISDDLFLRLETIAATQNVSIDELVREHLAKLNTAETLREVRARRLDELFALQDRKSRAHTVGEFNRKEIDGSHLPH